MHEGRSEWLVHGDYVGLVECFRATLYPIDLNALLETLPGEGWVVPMKLPPEGNRQLEQLPTKGNLHIRFDLGNKTLGIGGRSPTEVLEGFRWLRGYVENQWGLSERVQTDYLEFRYTGWIEDGSNPLEVFKHWWAHSDALSKLSAAVKQSLPIQAGRFIQYGLRLTPEGLDANRPEWAELVLTPQNISGSRRYFFDLVFRDPNRETAEAVAEKAEEILRTVLTVLQGD